MTLEGGCACGAVRYRLKRAPMRVHCCHCTRCQRHTGSAFVLNAIIEGDELELLQGSPSPTEVASESGRPHDIYRCPRCLTAVWSDYGRRPNYRFVRVGTLDTPAALPPDVHIFVRSKLPWVQLPPGVPAFDTFYPKLEDVWPPEVLARRERALRQ
ncbi:MAG: GFA family protein [Archangiaceae bacterium]|nr:GFA family protein [Archangiaceae bacterium]